MLPAESTQFQNIVRFHQTVILLNLIYKGYHLIPTSKT